VTFDSSPTNRKLIVRSGDYDFDMQGYTYSLTASAAGVTVGDASGSVASLTLLGGTLAGNKGYLGDTSGAGGTVTVDGIGSVWTNSKELCVGGTSNAARGAGELIVDNGGLVSAGELLKVWDSGTVDATGGEVVIGGAAIGEVGSLTIGSDDEGELKIAGGGGVDSITGYLGYASSSDGAMTVDGIGSTWTNSGSLYVGGSDTAAGGAGKLIIDNGGVVSAADLLKVWDSGIVDVDGGEIVVGGAGVGVDGGLTIGSDAAGELRIVVGGVVGNTDGYLGYASGGIGAATVDGAGSTWTNSGSLYIGGSDSLAGGPGELTVSDGGTVNVNDTLKLWSGGTLNISDGTVSARTMVNDGGVLNFTSGTLHFTRNFSVDPGEFLGSNPVLGFGMTLSVGRTLTVGGTSELSLSAGGVVEADEFELVSGATFNQAPGSVLRVNTLSGFGDNPSFVASLHLGYAGGNSGAGTHTVSSAQSLTVGEDFVVGYDASGTLGITGGGDVSSTDGYLGYSSGGGGTVTVDGIGSIWTNSSGLYVGYEGTGVLNVTDGGAVSSTDAYLGYSSGAGGTVTVDGTGSTWTNSSGLYVGGSDTSAGGTGLLTVQNHGTVDARSLLKIWGSGTVNVTTGNLFAGIAGRSPRRSETGWLVIGCDGTGAMSIVGGGSVSNVWGYIGWASGSDGTVTVDGEGSTWTNSGRLRVGDYGKGELNVLNGGRVSSLYGNIGGYGGLGSMVTVDGEGSIWTNSNSLSLGMSVASTLNVQNGGEIRVGDSLYAGHSGTLNLNAGGVVATDIMYLELGVAFTQAAGSVLRLNTLSLHPQWLGPNPPFGGSFHLGHAVGITGVGAHTVSSGKILAIGEDLVVGYDAVGTLHVTGGGDVSNTTGYLGYSSGGGGTVTVGGSGSTWANSEDLHVGYDGTGALNVTGTAKVSNTDGYLGYSSGSSGTATVDGVWSTWENHNDLYVGGSDELPGGTGLLTLQNGGIVEVGSQLKVWGSGTVNTVDGWTYVGGSYTASNFNDLLMVGTDATGTMSIVGGGSVSSSWGIIGYSSGSSGTVTVDGAGSTWTNSSSLLVGYEGTGELDVVRGGSVSDGFEGWIGYSSGSSGTVTIDGDGSSWTNARIIYVGYKGAGELNVLNGGSVSSNTDGYIGSQSDSDGTVTVDGDGSTWTNSGGLYIGGRSTGAGGSGVVTVGNGGEVRVGETLKVWDTGTLNLSAGGVVAADAMELVSGATFVQTLGSVLRVNTLSGFGDNPSFVATLHLGHTAGNTGSGAHTLSGAQSLTVGEDFVVGYDAPAVLTVDSGGEVRVGRTLTISDTGALNLGVGGVVAADAVEIAAGATFTQASGSALRVNTLSTFGDNPSFAGSLHLGHAAGASGAGAHTLNSGQSLSVGEDFVVGYDAPGEFINAGGTHTVGGELVLGEQAGSSGTYIYQGGSLNVPGGIRGGAGASEFAVGGGTGTTVLLRDGTGLSITDIDQFTIKNRGTIEVLDGATVSADQLAVEPGGLLGVDRGTVALAAALNNDGEVLLGSAISARIETPVVNNNGLLGGSGRVMGDVVNTGEMFVSTAERITVTGDVDNDSGMVTFSGGSVLVSGSLTNGFGGMVTGNGTLRADGGITNSSTMAFSGVANVFGDVDNESLIIVSGIGPTTFFDDVNNTGEIRAGNGCAATYFGNVDGPGSFTGLGTHYFEGDMSPGSSPGDVSIEGSAVFGSGAELCIELSGLSSGDEYDTLSIGQIADLGGTLDLSYLGPFAAAPGDQFTIIDAGSISDTFGAVAFPDAQDWFINYDVPNGNVVVGIVPEPATMILMAASLPLLLKRKRKPR
jgi:T5SS/PEP-CTERM-associated repeat protein